MNNLFSLFLRNGVRNVFNADQNKRISLFPVIILIVFTILQGTVAPAYHANSVQWIGFAIIIFFFSLILIGLVSNRLPSRMEDVVWIYSLPAGMEKIIWANVMWQFLIRGGFWIASAMLADVSRWILGFPHAYLLPKALAGSSVLFLLELWFIASSSSRAKTSLMVPLGMTAGTGVVLSVLALFFPSATSVAFANEVGNLFLGKVSIFNMSTLLLLIILAFVVVRIAAKEPLLIEKLVREADFWSEFKDFSSMATSQRGKEKPSYWGGDWLQGVLAFVWFEWVVLRKRLFSFLFQFVLGVTLALVILNWAPHWYGVMIAVFLVAFVAGGYFSGLIRHAQTGDLFLLPGHWGRKAFLLEVFDSLPAFVSAAIYTVLGVVMPNEFVDSYRMLLFLLLPLFVTIIGLRLWVFYRMNVHENRLSISRYYRAFIFYGSVIALFFIGAIHMAQNLALPRIGSMAALLSVTGIVLTGSAVRRFK